MRFLVGLAAAVWTLRALGPVVWFGLGVLVVGAVLLVWMLWPVLLVGGIIVFAFVAARRIVNLDKEWWRL